MSLWIIRVAQIHDFSPLNEDNPHVSLDWVSHWRVVEGNQKQHHEQHENPQIYYDHTWQVFVELVILLRYIKL